MPPELAERQNAAQQRVNTAVEAMDAAFEAINEARTALDDATDDNREALTSAFEEAVTRFGDAESAVFDAQQDHDQVERMAKARAGVKPIKTVDDGASGTRVVTGELTYRKFDGRADDPNAECFKYLRDVWQVQCYGNHEAARRLGQHMQEMGREGRVNPNMSAGQGGEFVPPLWLQEEWIELPRPARPAAQLIVNRPLPPETQLINLPKLATGVTVSEQTEAGAVSSTDATTTSVAGQVQTEAGQQDVSQQLIDRSSPDFDVIIFTDLTRAYDGRIDNAVLNSTVTNGKGLLQVSSIKTSSYTDGSPTVPELYPKGADILQKIATSIFMGATAWVMHTVRWAWFLAALDGNSRPLIVPNGSPYFNAAGTASVLGVAPENLGGTWYGLPVILDTQIPVTGGVGTNQDTIIAVRADQCYLYEDGTPRTRAHEQVLDNTLQVRLQLYNYFALICGRLPGAIGTITGTGLAAPTF